MFSESPALTRFGASAIATTVLLLVVQNLLKKRLPTPPGPNALPIIGNMLSFPSKHEWATFFDWKNKFGDIIHLHGFGQSIIVLNSKQAIDDLLERRGNLYSGRPRFTVVGEMAGLNNGMILLQDNDDFRLQRKLARTVMNGDVVKQYLPAQAHLIALMCRSFLEDPVHFIEHVRLAASQIVVSVAYGIPVSEAQHDYIAQAEETMGMVTRSTVPGAYLADMLPILKYIPTWVPWPLISYKNIAKESRAMLDRLVRVPFAHVVEEVGAGKLRPSFTHTLLAQGAEGVDEDRFKNAVMWSAGSIYGGGGEATYTSVLVFLIAMIRNPEVQKKAQKELDEVIGKGRMPDISDRGRLPYIDAVLKEVKRWKPATPLAIAHRLEKDDQYAGYHIPADSIIMPNIWAIAMDVPPKYPASEFIPERFLDENPPLDPSSYVFGFGRRSCPGKLLAENSIFLFATSILYCCNIMWPYTVDEQGKKHKSEFSVEFSSGMVSYPLPFKCTIEPRSPERTEIIKETIESYTN